MLRDPCYVNSFDMDWASLGYMYPFDFYTIYHHFLQSFFDTTCVFLESVYLCSEDITIEPDDLLEIYLFVESEINHYLRTLW